MSYRDLPEGCPPNESEEITSERLVFRLVKSNPATLEDFRSQREERPQAVFTGVTECQARGISVFTERRDAAEKVLRLPKFRKYSICQVMLTAGAGRIQQTFQPSHHTWWPMVAFDIIVHSEAEAP
ncbi:hypothetical protein ACXR0O_07825 [Verrucomicrobiota bacterium sgz303538]